MARLSVEIVENVTAWRPETGARPSASRRASSDQGGVATTSRSPLTAHLSLLTSHCLLDDLALIEWQLFRTNDLIDLMTLPREKNGVPGVRFIERRMDRGKPVRDS